MLADDPTTAFLVMGGLLVALVVIVLALRRGTEVPRKRIDDEYLPQERRDFGLNDPTVPMGSGMSTNRQPPSPPVLAPGLLGGSIVRSDSGRDGA